MVGDSSFGPHRCHSGHHDEGCSSGGPLFSAPPVHTYGHLGYHACRGYHRGSHAPGSRWLSHRHAPIGGRMWLCHGPWQAFPCCEGARGRMHHCHVKPTTHVGWHCVVEMLSSPPVAPPCARAACRSRAMPSVSWASWAPRTLKAEPPPRLCSSSPR
jgi:hypothetical protein